MIHWIKTNKLPSIFIAIVLIISIIYGIGSGLGFISSKDTYTKLIPPNHPNRPSIKNTPIAVVVHYTGNSSFTATDFANVNYAGRKYVYKNGKYYEADGVTPFRYGSAHWYIDQDSATLAIPQNEVAYAVGDSQLPKNNGYNGQTKIAKEVFNHRQNYMSISYEICNNANWEKACENAVDIIAKDMITYNIPTDRIYRHYNLSGKKCPLPMIDEKIWSAYKQKIVDRVHELEKESIQHKPVKVMLNGKVVDIDAVSMSGKNYIGIRNLLEQMGYQVIWHQDTQVIEVKK